MKLNFNLNEPEALALTELFYKDSPSHQRIRNQTRWVLPIFLLPIVVLFTLQFGFSLPSIVVFAIAIVGWIIIAPRRFDARIRRHVQNLLKESSFEKSFGQYTIQINDGQLVSDGPTGHGEYNWNSVDRTILTDSYLFIYLSGASGFAIKTSEIGTENARNAHNRVQQMMEMAK